MADVRPNDDLVARVVAWHNRNPLARRIAPAQVVSVGVVSFPFWAPGAEPQTGHPSPPPGPTAADAAATAPAGGRLRDRARARAAAADPPPRAAPDAAAAKAPDAQRRSWRAAFDQDLLDPHSPREVARWALRHGSPQRPGPVDAPVRDLEVRGGADRGAGVVRLWLYTAAIDLGAQRVRVLVSPLDARRVLGLRLVGRARLGALAGALSAGVAAGVVASVTAGLPQWLPGSGSALPSPGKAPWAAAAPSEAAASAAAPASSPAAATGPAAAAAVAGAASVAEATPATAVPSRSDSASAAPTESARESVREAAGEPAHEPSREVASEPPRGASHPPEDIAAPGSRSRAPPAPARAASARAPADTGTTPAPRLIAAADPTLRHSLVPALSEEVRRAAREASEAARRERAGQSRAHTIAGATPARDRPAPAGSAGIEAARPTPEATRPTSTATAPAAAPATAWAVSTRKLRTRFESEQMLAALRDVAYRGGHGSELKLEVLPSGDDWRAVGWPFATRADAERLRAALAARGLATEIVQF